MIIDLFPELVSQAGAVFFGAGGADDRFHPHMLDVQTITHGLNDSPAGMLAWILKRWKKWSDQNGVFEDAFPVDHILTNATSYWVNQAIGTSIRAYKNASLYPWTPSHARQPPIEAPAGFTFLLGDASPPGARTPEQRIAMFKAGGGRFHADVRNVKVYEKGGHFGPWRTRRPGSTTSAPPTVTFAPAKCVPIKRQRSVDPKMICWNGSPDTGSFLVLFDSTRGLL